MCCWNQAGCAHKYKNNEERSGVLLVGLLSASRCSRVSSPVHPDPGYRDLVVGGYQFVGNTVVGNCSFLAVSISSGRGGGHGQTTKRHPQTCTWDLYGKLLGVTPGALAVLAPLTIQDTQAIYAVNANGGSTGTVSKVPGGGFVSTPGPHYSWLTPNPKNCTSGENLHALCQPRALARPR